MQGTPGSQRLELLAANLGTIGYRCKELPVPRNWNSWFLTLEPLVTVARNCRFPEIGTPSSQLWNHRLPLQGTPGSQTLELLVPSVETIGFHCKELPCLVLFFWSGTQRCVFAYWSGTEFFVSFNGPVWDVLFCLLVRYRTLCFWLLVRYTMLCFAYWSGTERFVLLIGPVQNALFLLNGPVQNAFFG